MGRFIIDTKRVAIVARLWAGTLGIAALASIAWTVYSPPIAQVAYENLAAKYGVTIDWSNSIEGICGEGHSGCMDFESPDSVNVKVGLPTPWTIYVVLHEIGHVIQFRGGGHEALDECAADQFALTHGATVSWYDC